MTVLKKCLFRLSILVLIISVFYACSSPSNTALPTATIDIQATVDRAVAATATAQAEKDEAIAHAVAATQTAIPTATPPASDAPTTAPTPEAPQDVSTETYVTMTEEELAALIDASVTEAVAATESASTTTETITADDVITQAEADELDELILLAEEAIDLAEELMWVYAELYGELATETLVLIDELELVLAATADLLVIMVDILEDVNYALEAGIELTAETLAALNEAAQKAEEQAVVLNAKAQTWPTTVQAELAQRVDQYLAMVPPEVAESRKQALESAVTYVTTAREALTDQVLSLAELNEIAQQGAYASASLQAQGGVLMQNLANQVNGITTSFARGEIPNIQGKLSELESMIPSLP